MLIVYVGFDKMNHVICYGTMEIDKNEKDRKKAIKKKLNKKEVVSIDILLAVESG